jgi:hypothetical protein
MPIIPKATITPIHLAIAVTVVVIAIVALPMINSAYETAYPPPGSTKRFIIDQCDEKDASFSRWSSENVHDCLTMYSLMPREILPMPKKPMGYENSLRRQKSNLQKPD